MTAVMLAGGVATGCILAYAVLGGADFGGGVWDMLASGPRRTDQREAVGLAMGPVWETNHIWLIFAIVTLFTCFPQVFAKLAIALYFPLTFALAGIVMRGAAFAFRGPSTSGMWIQQIWGHIFGVASLLTPFFFGTAAAAVATGTFDWLRPFSLLVGAFAVTLCAQLAAVFLCAETTGKVQEDFRNRAMIATFAVAAAGAIAILDAALQDRTIFARLVHGWPLVALAMIGGLAVLGLVRQRSYLLARASVGLEVMLVLSGWFLAQSPFLQHDLGLPWKTAPDVTIVTYLWIVAAGSLVLAPSLWLLFSLFKRRPAAGSLH